MMWNSTTRSTVPRSGDGCSTEVIQQPMLSTTQSDTILTLGLAHPRGRISPPAASYLTYLLPCPGPAAAVSLVWHRPPGVDLKSEPVTILELRATIERGTTGLHTWRASLELAEWIFENCCMFNRVSDPGVTHRMGFI
ncbi:hypothetical protein FS749_003026 [Ceratobasidium sp. UAMH 11750]|nr:hypothetical protein FS749_003026 [Ceratobasidium sp. UAMH 11750]